MYYTTIEKYSKELLQKEYEQKQKGFRQICGELKLNGRTLKKLLLYYGIPIRYGTEAIKSQWIGEKGKYRRLVSNENRKYRTKTNDGYYEVIFDGKHKSLNKGRVKEHILILEKKIGRRLFDGEVCHHIDGNKLNNLPSNLQLMTKSEHHKLHGKDVKERMQKLHREGKLQIIRGNKGQIAGVKKF